MTRLIAICCLAVLSLHCKIQMQDELLFPFYENGRVGYINAKGSVIIAPQFMNGADFSEGLAAVRRDGLFGYINDRGVFAIEPTFDHAENFINGLALVFNNGVQQVINKKGKIVLAGGFKEINFLKDHQAIITTASDKWGVIDLNTSHFIADTVYKRIDSYDDGLFVLSRPNEKKKYDSDFSVIDQKGNVIVPFGKYRSIGNFNNGYAAADYYLPGEEEPVQTLIDNRGRELFHINPKNELYILHGFNNGLGRVYLSQKNSEKNGQEVKHEYEGFINLKGEVVMNDPACKSVLDFNRGRSFVADSNNRYTMIDTAFRRLTPPLFRNVNNGFSPNGYAVVSTEEGDGIIDTTGKFVLSPGKIIINNAIVMGNVVFFDNGDGKYGLISLDGKEIIKPVMQSYNQTGFSGGVLKAIVDSRLTYFNEQGNIIWQAAKINPSKKTDLNIDYMNCGYFVAYSSPETGETSGGWAVSNNIPKHIKGDEKFAAGQLMLQIDPAQPADFANRFNGYTVYVANAGKDTVKFDAQDSRLYMTVQAINKNGDWQDIEYLPASWCGNSYHTISLEPGMYWQFVMPRYQGGMKTSLRIRLMVENNRVTGPGRIIFSNIIQGSVNPGQFCYKNEYRPGNIMDPYLY